MIILLILLSLFCGGIASAQTVPTIGTCVSTTGTGNLTVPPISVAAGQSIIVFHKGTGATNPGISDTQGDTFVSDPNTNTASSGCINADYAINPPTGTKNITVNGGFTGAFNSAVACTVNNFNSFDIGGGNPYTSGGPARTGIITPNATNELILGTYYAETPTGGPSWTNSSTNYTGSGTPTDIASATSAGLSGTTGLLTGGLTETSTTGVPAGMQRSFTSAPSGNPVGTNPAYGVGW